MIYDRKTHITTDQLADLLGVPTKQLSGLLLRGKGGPRALFKIRVDGREQSAYDRAEAVAWVDRRRETQSEYRGETVPPRDPSLYANRRPYQSGPQMSINQQRAAEVYPHRLITPDGVGNGREFAPGFDQGR